MHEIMTIEEVAAYLRVSERTVYEWAQKGDLPGGKIGTTWRFKSADIEKWVNDRLKGQGAAVDKHTVSSVMTAERVFCCRREIKWGVGSACGFVVACARGSKCRDASQRDLGAGAVDEHGYWIWRGRSTFTKRCGE